MIGYARERLQKETQEDGWRGRLLIHIIPVTM